MWGCGGRATHDKVMYIKSDENISGHKKAYNTTENTKETTISQKSRRIADWLSVPAHPPQPARQSARPPVCQPARLPVCPPICMSVRHSHVNKSANLLPCC